MVNETTATDDAERLRWQMRVLEAITVGVTVADARQPDIPLVYVNPAFLSMTGYAAEDVLGKNCRFLQAHDSQQPEVVIMREALREGRDVSLMLRNYRKDGSLFWNQLSLAPVRDQRGQITHFVGIQQDLTALQDAQMRAERAQRQTQSVIDSLQGLICVIDLHGTIHSVNCSWRQALSQSGMDVARLSEGGNYLEVCDQSQGQDSAGVLGQGIRDVLAGVCASFEVRTHVCWASPHQTYLIRVRPLLDAINGQPAVVISHQDITKEIQFQMQLRQAKEEAERANQAKSEFLSQMSHELRTPMNAILGFGQLLEQDPRLDAMQRESVLEILHGGRQLLKLINEILELGRLEAGQFELRPEAVAMASLVTDCLTLVEPLALARQVTLQASDMQDLVLWADRKYVKQVIVNLLANAILYNHAKGTVSLNADLVQGTPRRLRLEIADRGQGIPQARLRELFQPFMRREPGDPYIDGSGIGLASCARLTEAMGGRFEVESVSDAASLFWIELPAATPDHHDF